MFEVKHHDLLGRIGYIKTKTGTFETPALLPVVNPVQQIITPRELYEMGFRSVITNAYVLLRRKKKEAEEKGVHKLLDYPGVVMTDSGAYQLLVYGRVETTPEEVVEFQEKIGSDIAVILDVPTGFKVNRAKAEQTVEETLRRARELFLVKKKKKTLWVGPVQGGTWLDLVKRSAEEIAKLPFHMYALGSPTRVMEQYMFDLLVDMILTAKTCLPITKPFHLFGAGHPMMFPLAAALGCDTFDSASYAIYAKQRRYMYEGGTLRLEDLDYLPCSCPVCSKLSPEELREMPDEEAERNLARHNLYACLAEIRRVKQAIAEGRLWELLEARARTHPSMKSALAKLNKYVEIFERFTPLSKRRGLFFYDNFSLTRPEAERFRRRVKERFKPPREASILLLLPPVSSKPYTRNKKVRNVLSRLSRELEEDLGRVHLCIYTALGIVPLELDEVYPASQHEGPPFIDKELATRIANDIADYIGKAHYKAVLYHHDPSIEWGTTVYLAVLKTCLNKNLIFKATSMDEKPWSRQSIEELSKSVMELLNKIKEKT